MDSERIAALEDLVFLRPSVDVAANRCNRTTWDGDTELVVLSTHGRLGLLDDFLNGTLTGDDCEVWATTLEGRDDVGLEGGAESLRKDLLFNVSTPELQGPHHPREGEGLATPIRGQDLGGPRCAFTPER